MSNLNKVICNGIAFTKKIGYYFASFEVNNSDLYLLAIGLPYGEDLIKIDIYVGCQAFPAKHIIGGAIARDSQSSFEERVKYELEVAGEKYIKEYLDYVEKSGKLV